MYYMHEMFHSFPPTSRSKVISREWWRWLSHDSTTHCALKCICNKLWGTASHLQHTLTYTLHMHWWCIPLLAMYVHGTHWSILTAHIIVQQAMGPLHIICITPLYVNTYVCHCMYTQLHPLCSSNSLLGNMFWLFDYYEGFQFRSTCSINWVLPMVHVKQCVSC